MRGAVKDAGWLRIVFVASTHLLRMRGMFDWRRTVEVCALSVGDRTRLPCATIESTKGLDSSLTNLTASRGLA